MRLALRILLPSLLVATLGAAQIGAAQIGAARAGGGTVVRDSAALQQLYTNSGVTLHWIGFETPRRGPLGVRLKNGLIHLTGAHRVAGVRGSLTIDGDVLAIDARQFTFRGRIVILGSPDPGRRCIRDGTYQFRATGTRRYWRLQQMEQCDGLTDYVDIYY